MKNSLYLGYLYLALFLGFCGWREFTELEVTWADAIAGLVISALLLCGLIAVQKLILKHSLSRNFHLDAIWPAPTLAVSMSTNNSSTGPVASGNKSADHNPSRSSPNWGAGKSFVARELLKELAEMETMQVNFLEVRKTAEGWVYLSEGVGNDPDRWCDATNNLGPFGGSGINVLLDELSAARNEAACNPAGAAIQFALADEDGMEFLRRWNEGAFEVIRREWPDAPEEVFIAADQFHKDS